MAQLLHAPNPPHQRLRRARVDAGYETAAEFATAAGVKVVTYQHHENGRRELRPEIASLYARLLDLSPGTLLYGEQLLNAEPISIVATVNKQGKLKAVDARPEKHQTVNLPDPASLVGFTVVGDDLFPIYRDGDVVFHRRLNPNRFSLESLNGLECVVELADGTQLLRHLIAQSNGRATLLNHQPNGSPPQFDVVVVAASPVEFVQRRMPPTLFNR
jgi:DNA-binding XRE family transcriptional regulator